MTAYLMSGHSARTTGRTMQIIPMAVFIIFLLGGVNIEIC